MDSCVSSTVKERRTQIYINRYILKFVEGLSLKWTPVYPGLI